MSEHVLRVEVDVDWVHLRVECRAAVGAPCRLVCAEDCGAETLPCFGRLGNEHELKDSGLCTTADWLNEDGAETSHQRVTEPVFDGMPIVCEWEGDFYSWRGAGQNPPADRAFCHHCNTSMPREQVAGHDCGVSQAQ